MIAPVSFRDATRNKDKRMVNCYPDGVVQGQTFLTKRPGLSLDTTVAAAAEGRGVYSWRDIPYSVVGTGLYNNTTSIQTLTTSTGLVSMSELDTGVKYLLIHDGVKLYQVETDNTVTAVTDPDFPAAMVPGLVVIDGYTFVMDANGTIYNSEQDNPLSWLSADFISAEIDADSGIAIAKHLNYLVAFGEWTTEIFYDAGNATGSPLARIPSAVIRYGCAAKHSVAEGENFIAWVSHGKDHGHNVMAMEGLQPVKISTKPIERMLNQAGSDVEDSYAFLAKSEGHYFYVLTIPASDCTLVYDFVDKQWHEWTSDDGVAETYFAGVSSCEQNEEMLIQHEDDGKLYKFDPTVYQDMGQDINVLVRTNKLDFGNNTNKFLHRLEIVGDWTTASSTMAVRWSDDDYQTWSTSRNIDLSKRPTLNALGRFARRAFEFTYADNYPLRIEALELTGELGDNVEGTTA